MNSNIFDGTAFESLIGQLGADDADEVLRLFLADTGDRLHQLAQRNVTGVELKREAHAIKSSAATFGFANLSMLARSIEGAAATMNNCDTGAAIRTIHTAFEAAARHAQTHLLKSAQG